ncbi:hypothetical protein SD37_24560 [Amycolatopsis orientalis]|uniref:Glycosyltransferase RgtA/B/C/D-like domain-containing protein n=1 Tax=Amycolatopsis orientalis TaxID=31958 RepID=A0A193C254_AMYOR|nr:hypothetical protein [Amycolatopsis orientalis]ANN18483.1 hypothetical protein SD37_24560 [Amycolatopsis orientalis]
MALGERPSPVTLTAFVAGVVPFLLHIWAALRGSLAQDDFVITYHAAKAGPFDFGYFFQDYHGHLAPGGFLLADLLTAWQPLDFAVLMAPLLLMQAAASVLLWTVLVRCFGRRWGILVPFTMFTTSTLQLVPTLWWAYALQFAPVLLATTAALHAHVRYLADGGRWAIATVAWTVFGLAFYEKAVFIPVLLAGVTVLLGVSLRRHVVLWGVLIAVLAGYAAVFLTLTSSQVGQGTGPVTVGTVADMAGRMIGDTLVPGMVGGPWSGPGPGATFAASGVVVRILLLLAAVVVLVAGVRTGGVRARKAWLLLGVVFAADVGLSAATRLTEVGPELGSDPRYVADLALVVALCVAFAFLEPKSLDRPSDPLPSPAKRPLALVVCLALIASSAVGFSRLAPGLRFDHSREFLANARASVARDPDLVLYDTTVPNDILHGWFGVNARTSRVVGLIPGVLFDQPTSRMSLLDASGTARPITGVDPVSRGVPGPVAGCGHPVAEQLVRVPLDTPVLGRYLLRIDYFTADGGEGVVDRDGVRVPVWFQPGLHTMYLPIEGLFDKVGFQLSAKGAPVCLAKVEVGKPLTQ